VEELGDGTFQEQHLDAGLNDSRWSTAAGWGDVDGDGDLDLYIVHYVNWSFENHPNCRALGADEDDICPPEEFAPLADTLWMSNGDGTFRQAAFDSGLRADGKGLGVVLADLDGDGHLDIYVANDSTDNFFYRNDGFGGFIERAVESGTAVAGRDFRQGVRRGCR
jgi:enediyne biosynthesis protein E4